MPWIRDGVRLVTGPKAPLAWKLGSEVLVYLPASKELFLVSSKKPLRKLTKVISPSRQPSMWAYPDGSTRWHVAVGRTIAILNGKRVTVKQYNQALGLNEG